MALGILLIILVMVNVYINPTEDSQLTAIAGWIIGGLAIIYSLHPHHQFKSKEKL
jgi:hypothetical protein